MGLLLRMSESVFYWPMLTVFCGPESSIQPKSVFYLNKSFIKQIRRAELVMDELFCSDIVTLLPRYTVVISSYINIRVMVLDKRCVGIMWN